MANNVLSSKTPGYTDCVSPCGKLIFISQLVSLHLGNRTFFFFSPRKNSQFHLSAFQHPFNLSWCHDAPGYLRWFCQALESFLNNPSTVIASQSPGYTVFLPRFLPHSFILTSNTSELGPGSKHH